MGKYYILRLDSYSGEHSELTAEADGKSGMFAVLKVEGPHADIVDYGYSSVAQLLRYWSPLDVTFVNRAEFIKPRRRSGGKAAV